MAKLVDQGRTSKPKPATASVKAPALAPPARPVRDRSPAVDDSAAGVGGAGPASADLAGAGGAAVSAAVSAAAAFWDSMDTPTKIRTGLELTRPIPLVGILTGLASDAIGLATDLEAVPKGSDMTTLTVGLRDMIALFGNVLGGAAAADQALQDVISVTPLAPADAITASINEGLLGAKVWADGATVFLDLVIMAEAKYNKSTGPQDKATLGQWDGIFKSFEASILSDTLTGVIDGLDLIALGFSNGQGAKGMASMIATAMKRFVPLARTIVGVVLNEFSIHGFRLAPGLAPPVAAGAAAAAGPSSSAAAQLLPGGGNRLADAAAAAALDGLIAGLGQAHGVWQSTDESLGEAEARFRTMEAQSRALISIANGGKDPFIVMRNAAKKSLDRASASIGEMIEMGQVAGEVVGDAEVMRAGCDDTLALISKMRIPEVHLPKPSGDGLLDEAEAIAASLADQAFQLALSPARARVDSLREELSRPVVAVRERATEIAAFNKALQETCTEGAAKLQAHVALFAQKLGHVQNFEQIIDLLLHELTEALGVEGGAGLADVRKAWAEAGDALVWGQTAAKSVRANIGSPKRGEDKALVGAGAAVDPPPDTSADDGSSGR